MKRLFLAGALTAATFLSVTANAANYQIDVEGAHASINFKINHLGYSLISGRFNTFDGGFSYDAKKQAESKVKVVIQTGSLDSNHAERDKHLKGEDFLNVSKYPTASFTSTKYVASDAMSGVMTGTLELHGVKNTISIPVQKVGEGDDPWGSYRAGFSGTTTLKLSDYGIDYDLGPSSTTVELELNIEGVKQ